MKKYLKENANLPNALTLLRLLSIPVYLHFFIAGQRYVALTVFVAACFTDLLDGYLARKLHQITSFGKLMDPLADKLMVITVMISLVVVGVVPWPAAAILLLKEGYMVVGGYLLLRHGVVVYSLMIGKVAHCLFIAALVACFFHEWFAQVMPGLFLTPDQMLVWLAVLTTLCAMAFYTYKAVRKGRSLDLFRPDKVQSFREVARNFTSGGDAGQPDFASDDDVTGASEAANMRGTANAADADGATEAGGATDANPLAGSVSAGSAADAIGATNMPDGNSATDAKFAPDAPNGDRTTAASSRQPDGDADSPADPR